VRTAAASDKRQAGLLPAPSDNAYSYPLTGASQATGTNDILFDFLVSGGTLANSFTWGNSSARSYYLDGCVVQTRELRPMDHAN
jgi:hypothetical protein